jgi:ABC-type Co2+ transport system permease subunit
MIGRLVVSFYLCCGLYREQRWITQFLREEVNMGIISPAHYQIACSMWKQSAARWRAMFSGRYQVTSRFYQACAELAHKKQQFTSLGDEGGNTTIIQNLRAEISNLAPYTRV